VLDGATPSLSLFTHLTWALSDLLVCVKFAGVPRTTNGHKVRDLYVHSMSHNTYIRGRRARSPLPTGNGQRSPRRFAPHGWPFRDDSDDEWDGFSGFHHLSLNVSEIIEAHRDRWGVANGSPSGWHSVGSRPRPWWESVGNTGRWPVRPGEGSRPLPDPDRPRPGRPVVEDTGWYIHPPPPSSHQQYIYIVYDSFITRTFALLLHSL